MLFIQEGPSSIIRMRLFVSTYLGSLYDVFGSCQGDCNQQNIFILVRKEPEADQGTAEEQKEREKESGLGESFIVPKGVTLQPNHTRGRDEGETNEEERDVGERDQRETNEGERDQGEANEGEISYDQVPLSTQPSGSPKGKSTASSARVYLHGAAVHEEANLFLAQSWEYDIYGDFTLERYVG